MLRCTSTIGKITLQMDPIIKALTFTTTPRESSLNTREFSSATCKLMKKCLMRLWKHNWVKHFYKENKRLFRSDRFLFYGKLGVDFFSTSELLYPIMKVRLRLIRAQPNFQMISCNPSLKVGIVDCSSYTRRIALKEVFSKNRTAMLGYTPLEFNYLNWKLWQRRLSFLPDKTSFIRDRMSTKLQFTELPFEYTILSIRYSEYNICIPWIVYSKSILVSTI